MKKILSFLLALTISQPAMAQWVQIKEGTNTTGYYDPNRIESYDGIYQSIWLLLDYKTTQQNKAIMKPYRSQTDRFIVDCSKKEIRIISGFWYSGNMGRGGVVDSSDAHTSFASAPPNSLKEILMDLACKK